MSRPRILVVALAAIAAAAGGCKKKKAADSDPPEPPAAADAARADRTPLTWIVSDVEVELVAQQGQERDVDARAIARRVGERIRATPHFAAAAVPEGRRGVAADLRVRITYGVIEEGSIGAPATFAAVEGILEPRGESPVAPRDNVVTERAIGRGEKGAALDAALIAQIDQAVDEMVAGVLAKEALRDADREALAAALGGQPEMVLWALELIGDRSESRLAPRVRALLGSSDPRIAAAAITCVVAIGDREAVAAMTAGIDFQDHERMRVAIEAASALGGEEARQFLDFVATGHPDPDVKEHAADALERLRQDRRR